MEERFYKFNYLSNGIIHCYLSNRLDDAKEHLYRVVKEFGNNSIIDDIEDVTDVIDNSDALFCCGDFVAGESLYPVWYCPKALDDDLSSGSFNLSDFLSQGFTGYEIEVFDIVNYNYCLGFVSDYLTVTRIY